MSLTLESIKVGYDPDLYVATESAGSVYLTISVFSHPGGAPRPFFLLVNTEDGTASMSDLKYYKLDSLLTHTAVVDNDYVPVSGQLIQFSAGDATQMHTIIINDDDECENYPNQKFFSNSVLNSGIPYIFVTTPRATVTINDSADPGCYGK